MPKTTVTHETWCAGHIGPDVGLAETCCTNGVDFGSLMPKRQGDPDDEDDTRGSLFVQLAEDEPEAVAMLEWAPKSGQLDLGALHAIRAALLEDPAELLRAIEETLAELEVEVSA